jgi:hypothetical protein
MISCRSGHMSTPRACGRLKLFWLAFRAFLKIRPFGARSGENILGEKISADLQPGFGALRYGRVMLSGPLAVSWLTRLRRGGSCLAVVSLGRHDPSIRLETWTRGAASMHAAALEWRRVISARPDDARMHKASLQNARGHSNHGRASDQADAAWTMLRSTAGPAMAARAEFTLQRALPLRSGPRACR